MKDDREFLIGVLWAAWWLHSGHGEDTYAGDLILESIGEQGVSTMRRLARTEQYRFKPEFWTALSKKAAQSRVA